jgi:outer membrane immunogenic protein
MRRRSPGLLVLMSVAASALATAASAADLPVPATTYVAPAYRPAIYDWTGFYIGANVGGDWGNATITTSTTTAFQPAGTATKVSSMGVLGGVQAGFNVQFSPVVIGFEATWDATSLTGTQSVPSSLFATAEQSTVAATWVATATGRLGFAANDFLFYAKGGVAWMRADHTQALNFNNSGFLTLQTITDNRSGFTAGAGVEFGMTENLSLKVEYDYLGFGTKNYNFGNLSTNPAPGVTVPLGAFPVAEKSSVQMVVAGINYRFNWWGGGGVPVTK